MNAPAAIPLALIGRVEAALQREATENLITRLFEGEKVGRCTLRDLLHCELDTIPNFEKRFEEIMRIIEADPLERAALVDQLKHGLIERYLDSHIDLVHDEMDRLEEPNAD